MRFTRDERGYEYTSLILPIRREGRTDNLLLYRFRTPPYVKVGRAALDPEVMARLERQYPHVRFDWDKILREPPQTLSEEEATRRKEQRDSRDARRRRRKPLDQESVTVTLPEGDLAREGPPDEGDVLTDADLSTSDAPAEGTVPTVEGAHKRKRRRHRRRKPERDPGGNPPPNTSV